MFAIDWNYKIWFRNINFDFDIKMRSRLKHQIDVKIRSKFWSQPIKNGFRNFSLSMKYMLHVIHCIHENLFENINFD